MSNQTAEKRVKAWAWSANGKIVLAERCSKRQFLINWGHVMRHGETVERAEIRILRKRK